MLIDKSKFRRGQKYITKAIFYENAKDKDDAVFTLKDYDVTYNGITYPSLRRMYMELADPTEFRLANEVLLGWAHWTRLLAQGWFQQHVQQWREELDVQLRSKALEDIKAVANDKKDKNNYNATKFLVEQGYMPKEKKGGVGRTTKEKISSEAHKMVSETDGVKDDYKRLKLVK